MKKIKKSKYLNIHGFKYKDSLTERCITNLLKIENQRKKPL